MQFTVMQKMADVNYTTMHCGLQSFKKNKLTSFEEQRTLGYFLTRVKISVQI